MSKRIIIIGTRRGNSLADYENVATLFFSIYEVGDIIVSGGCSKGGDKFAEMISRIHNIPITIYKADWSLGRHAGFLRNTTIAEKGNELIACVAPDRKGGTEDTIKKFKKFHPEGKIHLRLCRL